MATWTAAAVATLFISSLASFAQVNLPIGTLLPGEKVTLTFDVTITNPFPASATSVTNQGTVSGNGQLRRAGDHVIHPAVRKRV